jgi:8-oxo-dGTP pyrophosphatase MutT (NUDIX family)
MPPVRYRKVVAYITRTTPNGSTELLVFDHRDYPDSGTQVPAGTVEEGESIEAALAREVLEETGRADLRPMRMLAHYDWVHPRTGNIHERHVFHLEAPPGVPDAWSWIETSGGGVSDEDGYVFVYRWVPLNDVPALAGHLGDHLEALKAQFEY